jgi:hypothetical protein
MLLKVHWGRGVEVYVYPCLTSVLDWGGRSAPRPDDLFPQRRPETQRTVHDIGPGRILKILSAPGFKPRSAQLVACSHTD